jgi:hypothetical protein
LINPQGNFGYDPMDANLDIAKPIKKYYKNEKVEQKSYPLKYFKG